MPKERFSDELIASFFNHAHGTPKNDRHRGNNRQWALTSSRGFPAKTIRVTYSDWLDLIRLVERHGYRCPSDNVGLAGDHVRLFAEALAHGLNEEKLGDPLCEATTKVLDFVRGPGRDGFKMQSQWT
jgi:hypothetical protein